MGLRQVLDQTVRDLKREVNTKLLMIPAIEQKVLDATSNEPVVPHQMLMADIARASRNHIEYELIMPVLWKRINDTGRCWRHVYKALMILEFLVAHGSERVIEEVREHVYSISTLFDFQYVESSGKDQGVNVRKKAQDLVALIKYNEKVRNARQKRMADGDKYRRASSFGGIYTPSLYFSTGVNYDADQYDDSHYGNASRYGDWDNDRHGRDRDIDQYRDEGHHRGRDSADRHGRGKGRDVDRYRDEGHFGRGRDRAREGDRYRDEGHYGRDTDPYTRENDRYDDEGDCYRDHYSRNYNGQEDCYSSKRGGDRLCKNGNFEKDEERAYSGHDHHSSRIGRERYDNRGLHDSRRVDCKPSGARIPATYTYDKAIGSSDSECYRTEDRRDGGDVAAVVVQVSKSNGGQTANNESTSSGKNSIVANNQSDDFDNFDPRDSVVPTPVEAHQCVDVFGKDDPARNLRALPSPRSLTRVHSTASDLLVNSSFTFEFTPTPVMASHVQRLDGDMFGDSTFKVEAPVASNQPIVALTNLPSSFPAASVLHRFVAANASVRDVGGSNAIGAPTHQTASVSFVESECFGADSLNHFGAARNSMLATSSSYLLNQSQTLSAPGTARSGMALISSSVVNQVQTSISTLSQQSVLGPGGKASRDSCVRTQQKDKFETKSAVWDDTLSKGLIDLNIAGLKTKRLADIGIDFDTLQSESKKEERGLAKASTINMGKAMGSGSGLGINGMVPCSAPMGSMGMRRNIGMAPMSMEVGSGIGMGMGPGMGFCTSQTRHYSC